MTRRKSPKIIYFIVCFLLIFEQSGFAQVAATLDIAGHLTALHNTLTVDKFRPLHLRYLQYDSAQNNFRLLLDKGTLKNPSKGDLENTSKDLLRYFFIGLSLPNDAFWVNLRPDSPDNIIDDKLTQTDIGRILLEADLELKKDTARATSPETPEGKKYWDSLYKKAEELFGSQNVTIPTLTRPWIVPDEIIIRETQDSAYIYKATLKVMLEQDYLKDSAVYNFKDPRLKALNEYSSQLIRELIIPKLTKEVNTSKKYAALRQVYYSLILAQWFKARFAYKQTTYSRLIDSRNIANLTAKQSYSKETFFKQYQESFKEGEYNLKEPIYTPYGQTIRSYFSGGFQVGTLVPQNPGTTAPTLGGGSTIRMAAQQDKPGFWGKARNVLASILVLTGVNTANPADFTTIVQNEQPTEIATKQIDATERKTAQIIVKGAPEEEQKRNFTHTVKMALDVLQDKIDLNDFRIEDNRIDSHHKAIIYLIVACSAEEGMQEIIRQNGVDLFLSLLGKEKLIPDVIDAFLEKAPRDLRRKVYKELLNESNMMSDKARIVIDLIERMLVNGDKEAALIFIEEGGIVKLDGLLKEERFVDSATAISFWGYLVRNWPDNIPERPDGIVVTIKNTLYDKRPIVRSNAFKALGTILRDKPGYRKKVLDELSQARKKISILPPQRASTEIVLIIHDNFSEFEKHGRTVISQVVSQLLGREVDLNKEEAKNELGKEIAMGRPQDYDFSEIAKRWLKAKFGIALEIADEQSALEDLIKKHKDKTIVVSRSLGYLLTPSEIEGLPYRFVLPDMLNGGMPLDIVQNSEAKELIFVVSAGNDNVPRLFTHPVFDNVLVVGAVERDKQGLVRRASYSNYGPDVSLCADGRAPGGLEGTSFATPKVTGAILQILHKNPTLSVKGAVDMLNQSAKPLTNDPEGLFKDGYLGKGVVGNMSQVSGDAVHGMAKEVSQVVPERDRIKDTETAEQYVRRLENKYGVKIHVVRTIDGLVNAARQVGIDGNVGFGFGHFSRRTDTAHVYVLDGFQTDSELMMHEITEALARQSEGIAVAGAETGGVDADRQDEVGAQAVEKKDETVSSAVEQKERKEFEFPAKQNWYHGTPALLNLEALDINKTSGNRYVPRGFFITSTKEYSSNIAKYGGSSGSNKLRREKEDRHLYKIKLKDNLEILDFTSPAITNNFLVKLVTILNNKYNNIMDYPKILNDPSVKTTEDAYRKILDIVRRNIVAPTVAKEEMDKWREENPGQLSDFNPIFTKAKQIILDMLIGLGIQAIRYIDDENQPTIVLFNPKEQIEEMEEVSIASSAIQQDVTKEASSTLDTHRERNSDFGGIDFRYLPIVTQAIGNLSANISRDSMSRLASVNLRQEWQEIEQLVNAGITPSAERIKDYLRASCAKGAVEEDIEKVILCISDILRLEEERCCQTEAMLRDILVVLEASRSSAELSQVFLGKVI